MALKLVVLSCLVAAACGGVAVAPVGVAPPLVSARLEEFDPLPQYRFGYNVFDALTGDNKSQEEQRTGDLVTGKYAVDEADGTRRIVTYSADSNGFNALVTNEPQGVLAAPVAPARYVAAAPAPVYEYPAASYAVAPAAVAPARLAVAPAAPVAAARFTVAPAPVAAARFSVAPAPVAAVAPAVAPAVARYTAGPSYAYATPFSGAAVTQYSAAGPLAYAQYAAPAQYAAAQYAAAQFAPAQYYTSYPAAPAPARLVAAAPAAPAAGYRYP